MGTGTARRAFRSGLLLRSGNGNGPTIGSAEDGASGDEARQRVAKALVADVEFCAELRAAERAAHASEQVDHAAIELAWRIGIGERGGRDDGEMGVDVLASDQLEAKWIGSRRGAMLDGEQQGVLLPADVEIGIPPGMKVTTAAE